MQRVFVASTAEDLKGWRQAARDVVLDAHWHPDLLNEHGGADTRPTVQACRDTLASCDLVLLLVAFRRGWVPTVEEGGDGARSITALELAHAREHGIPVLAFMARDSWPGKLWERSDEGRAWVDDFRAKLGQPAAFFDHEAGDLPAFRALLRSALAEYKLNQAQARRESTGSEPPRRISNLPFARNANYTGRDELLRALHERLSAAGAKTRVAALTGLGGIGKTQTALEYAYRYGEGYDCVWWLRAEDPATLAADYADLARELKLDAAQAPELRDRVRAVRDWLDQHERWILVFDNAPRAAALAEYRPRLPSGHVIVTSRDPSWSGVAVASELQPLGDADATGFLMVRTGDADRTSATGVARLLGGLPLALDQACAFAERSSKTLAQLLDLLRRKQGEVLRRGTAVDYPATVATTWELAFQALESNAPAAAALLRLMAWLSPDRISRTLLAVAGAELPSPLAEAVIDELALDDAVAELRRYSLIRAEGDALSLHRLVQVITRARMDDATQAVWSAAAIRLVEAAFQSDLAFDPAGELYAHVRPVAEGIPGGNTLPVVAAGLLTRLARHHHQRAEPEPARGLFEQALALLAQRPEGTADVAAVLQLELAQLLCAEGEFDNAHERFRIGLAHPVDRDALDWPFRFGADPTVASANASWVAHELQQGTLASGGGADDEIVLEFDRLLLQAFRPDADAEGAWMRELRCMRWRLWDDYGVTLPPVMVREGALPERTYLVHVDGVPISGKRLPLGKRFVHGQRVKLDNAGIPYDGDRNPLNGRLAAWVDDAREADLRAAEIVSVAPLFVAALQVQWEVQKRLASFLTHDDVMRLAKIHLDAAAALEVEARWLTPLTTVLRAMLQERVPVRNLRAIFDGLRTSMQVQPSLVQAVEEIRAREEMRWSLPGMEWETQYLRLTQDTERMLMKRVRQFRGEALLAIEPEQTQDFLAALRNTINDSLPVDAPPIAMLVAQAPLRPHVRRLVELEFPNLPVVSEREVPESLHSRVIATVDDVSGGDV